MIAEAICLQLANYAIDVAYLRDKGYDQYVVARLAYDIPVQNKYVFDNVQTIVKETYNHPEITPEQNGNLVLKSCEDEK